MKFRIAAIAILALTTLAGAEDVKVTAEIDSPYLVEGESFTLTLRVEGPLRGISAPEMPELSHFFLVGTSSSSNFSFINGRTHNEKTFHYSLIPDQAGDYVIPAIPVTVKGKTYETEPLSLSVHASSSGASAGGAQTAPPTAGGPSQAPPDTPRASDASGRVFIRSWADRDTVYVGEQVTHHFALYRDAHLRFRGNPQYDAPETAGFWSESLGDEISGYQKIDGRDYAVTELRTALFPHEAGELQVGAASLSVTLFDPYRDDFFSFGRGKEKILRTKPLDLEVQPLPDAGRPAGFSGTVARSLELHSRLEPGSYEAGQPLTLIATLTGYGNPRTFAAPELNLGGDFRDYDSDLQSHVKVDEDRIHVRKEFTWVIVPQRDGHLQVPALEYSWFDPESKRYRVARSEALELDVAPSSATETEPMVFSEPAQGVETLAKSIHHIKTEPLLAGDGERFPRSPSFWIALALPWPLLAGAWSWRKRRNAISADRVGHRARGAGKNARRSLREASAARSAGDLESFHEALAKGLRGYLADRLGVSASGLSDEDIDLRLAGGGIDDSLRGEIRGLLSECDFARFAPGSFDTERLDDLMRRAEAVIGELDRVKGSKRGSIIVGAMMILALVAPMRARAVEGADSAMADAARLYESGQFGDAARAWESLARKGVEDSRLWYNLGDAYFQQKRIGPAILAYRRALRLAPRDREIRENLELARDKRRDGNVRQDAKGFGRIWPWTRRNLSPGELALMSLVALWAATALLLLGILGRLSWRRLRGPLLAAVLLLIFLGLGAWRAEWEDWSGREAVLMASAVKAQSGPGEDYVALFELHEGAELRLLERRGDWLRVSLDPDLEGWVPAAGVETL